MTLCHLSNDMRDNLLNKLAEVRDQVDRIVKSMNDQQGCLLCEIAGIKELAHEVEALASFYHFQSSLFPHVKGMDEISKGLATLSEKHHGALIAVEQNEDLEPFIFNCGSTGTSIDAKVSSALLQTIFFPGNPLHDGAIIIKDGRITCAGCIFPLSEKRYTREGRKIGTRHRAALGLSELTDALVIVVSEETGQVSFALNEALHPIEVEICENSKPS